MAKKDNKTMAIGIAVAVLVVVAVVVAVIKLSGGNGGGEGGGSGSVDYSKVDVTVEYGDYDTMYTQAKAIQNGEMTGKIVKIDGIVSHPLSKYSIVETGEGGNKIGTEFEIEGAEESAYPEDGDHVIITGEVIEKQPLYFIIKTTPDYVEIVDAEE